MLRWNDKPYHTLDYEMKQIHGEKIYKIALNAGMTCPNRDGTCGTRGCIFCSAGGSGEFAVKKFSAISASETSIAAQIEQGKQYFHSKKYRPLFYRILSGIHQHLCSCFQTRSTLPRGA